MKSPFLCNKQYITVDNSYILLYTVYKITAEILHGTDKQRFQNDEIDYSDLFHGADL